MSSIFPGSSPISTLSCAIILIILIAGVKLESWKSIRKYTEEIKSLSCSPIQQLTRAAHGLLSSYADFEEGHYEINKSCTSSNGYVRGTLLSCSLKLIWQYPDRIFIFWKSFLMPPHPEFSLKEGTLYFHVTQWQCNSKNTQHKKSALKNLKRDTNKKKSL